MDSPVSDEISVLFTRKPQIVCAITVHFVTFLNVHAIFNVHIIAILCNGVDIFTLLLEFLYVIDYLYVRSHNTHYLCLITM